MARTSQGEWEGRRAARTQEEAGLELLRIAGLRESGPTPDRQAVAGKPKQDTWPEYAPLPALQALVSQ